MYEDQLRFFGCKFRKNPDMFQEKMRLKMLKSEKRHTKATLKNAENALFS